MTKFFFHLVSPSEFSRDDTGTEFPTFYDAFLDAHSAAADMSAELLRQQADPNRYRFVITDGEGCTLAELPFIETVRERDMSHRELHAQVRLRIQNCSRLRQELQDEFDNTRVALANTRALLKRSVAIGS